MISEIIEEWIKGILMDGITGNLSGLFDTVNAKVGEIAADVGRTPQAWNSGIFNMLHSLSETVIVPINSYYCGYLDENMSLDSLAAGVRHHYENSLNDITRFIEAHDDALPPEELEEARAKAHEAGLPFYEKPYNGEDLDPYVYDGHMSIEDYELMHRLMEQDKERSDRVNEVFKSITASFLNRANKASGWICPPPPKSCKPPCGMLVSPPTIRRIFLSTGIPARRTDTLPFPMIWCWPPTWTN